MKSSRIAAAVLLTAMIVPASRASVGDRWPMLAFASDRSCELAITSSGRTMQISASGLIPGETLGFLLSNGDMKPIALTLRAGGDGRLQRYYFPFRLNSDGGTVKVRIEAARCTMTASAPWTRNVTVIP